MKMSALVGATSDDGVKEILDAAGWTFEARGQAHCSDCATAPPIAEAVSKKRYR